MSYYERIIQADFGVYEIRPRGFTIVSNHPYGHGMIATDFRYNPDTYELTFANSLAGEVTDVIREEKISDTLKKVWSDAPVELRWQVHPEWPTAHQGQFIQDMLEMTWEAFCSR